MILLAEGLPCLERSLLGERLVLVREKESWHGKDGEKQN